MGLIKKDKIVEKGYIDIGRFPTASEEIKPQLSSEIKTSPDSFETDLLQKEEVETEIEPIDENQQIEIAYEKASQIIEQAQNEANEIIENANIEAESIRKNAREEGFEEGKRQGEQQISDLITQAMETLNESIKQRKKIIQDAEAEITRLALKIAEKIIRTEVTTNKETIANIVSEAISRVTDRENIIIKVNKEDLENVKHYKDKIAGVIDGIKNLSIMEDSQVEPGGCVIETNLGFVDARISTKLSLIEKSLGKALASESD